MEKLELRYVDAAFSSSGDGLKVGGYVNKTNQWSQTLGQRKKFVERILPGAFNKALSSGNEIHFLAEHDNAKILSSTRNDSLTLREDENGLYMEATISDTSWGRDYHTLIKDGIIQSMSFGMQVVKDSWKKLENGLYERSISDLALFEVSAVRNPAYVQSTIAARSIEVIEDVEIPNEVENQTENQAENREELNQMEMKIETRDKLATVLDEILTMLKDNQSVQKVATEVEEVVDKTVEAVEEVIETVTEAVETVTEKVTEKIGEVVKEAKDVVEVVEEVTKEIVEDVKEKVEEAKPADLTDYYKKLLDF